MTAYTSIAIYKACRYMQKFAVSDKIVSTWSLWQYGLWRFQTGGTNLERFLPKNQHTQRKLLNFENWVNGDGCQKLDIILVSKVI